MRSPLYSFINKLITKNNTVAGYAISQGQFKERQDKYLLVHCSLAEANPKTIKLQEESYTVVEAHLTIPEQPRKQYAQGSQGQSAFVSFYHFTVQLLDCEGFAYKTRINFNHRDSITIDPILHALAMPKSSLKLMQRDDQTRLAELTQELIYPFLEQVRQKEQQFRKIALQSLHTLDQELSNLSQQLTHNMSAYRTRLEKKRQVLESLILIAPVEFAGLFKFTTNLLRQLQNNAATTVVVVPEEDADGSDCSLNLSNATAKKESKPDSSVTKKDNNEVIEKIKRFGQNCREADYPSSELPKFWLAQTEQLRQIYGDLIEAKLTDKQVTHLAAAQEVYNVLSKQAFAQLEVLTAHWSIYLIALGQGDVYVLPELYLHLAKVDDNIKLKQLLECQPSSLFNEHITQLVNYCIQHNKLKCVEILLELGYLTSQIVQQLNQDDLSSQPLYNPFKNDMLSPSFCTNGDLLNEMAKQLCQQAKKNLQLNQNKDDGQAQVFMQLQLSETQQILINALVRGNFLNKASAEKMAGFLDCIGQVNPKCFEACAMSYELQKCTYEYLQQIISLIVQINQFCQKNHQQQLKTLLLPKEFNDLSANISLINSIYEKDGHYDNLIKYLIRSIGNSTTQAQLLSYALNENLISAKQQQQKLILEPKNKAGRDIIKQIEKLKQEFAREMTQFTEYYLPHEPPALVEQIEVIDTEVLIDRLLSTTLGIKSADLASEKNTFKTLMGTEVINSLTEYLTQDNVKAAATCVVEKLMALGSTHGATENYGRLVEAGQIRQGLNQLYREVKSESFKVLSKTETSSLNSYRNR